MPTVSDQYPIDLAGAIRRDWPAEAAPLPAEPELLSVLSTCYQASLLQEEARPITFRLILSSPDELPQQGVPPDGLQVLELSTPRPFSAAEIRRLSPATPFHRSMLAAGCYDGVARIWGVVHTGAGWNRATLGGRLRRTDLPDRLVLHVPAVGEVSAFCGHRPIATLRAGRVSHWDLDVFQSQWLPNHFADVRAEVLSEYDAEPSPENRTRGKIEDSFIKRLGQSVIRRTITVMRQQRHGGTVLFLPATAEINPDHVRIKYRLADREPRRQFRRVLLDTMRCLAERNREAESVGWNEYLADRSPEIAALDEAIFELGNLFAELSAVDGALLLTQRFELLGFGAEISGDIPQQDDVWRATGLDANNPERDDPQTFGTRHRSVFRLCHAYPEIVALVVSQDGAVRFVKRFGDQVVYFNHRATGAI